MDERLSWPSWMTCSGRFTNISGHPLAASQAQDRESSSAKYRRPTTVLHNQLHEWVWYVCMSRLLTYWRVS